VTKIKADKISACDVAGKKKILVGKIKTKKKNNNFLKQKK